jgi:predicted AlkP superfamily pyrophosphatase or phosphodiesterase
MRPLWILNCVGLVRAHLGSATPALSRLAGRGRVLDLEPALPAVTTTAQTTLLTGQDPSRHGIVGNGWYFRDLGEVWLWRQSEGLVQAPPWWAATGQPRVLKHFWWYAMNSAASAVVTPRPAYHHDGRKSPDCYAWPPELKSELDRRHGTFPLFSFWGPGAGIASTRWIAQSFLTAVEVARPDIALCYLPHLDYDLQRFGPTGLHLERNLRDLDAAVAPILAAAEAHGARVAVVSEYGIGTVDRAVFPNRLLRDAGFLAVQRNATGELLDAPMSRAFAVVDHQALHAYVRDPADVPAVAALLRSCTGVAEVYAGDERRRVGLDHPRSGEVVAFADHGCWFAHDWWLDPRDAPDFARCVEIHKKPGYDPRELAFDPVGGKRRAAVALLRKKLGFRYTLDCIGLDTSVVRGSHGRRPRPEERPLLIVPGDGPTIAHQREAAGLLAALAAEGA